MPNNSTASSGSIVDLTGVSQPDISAATSEQVTHITSSMDLGPCLCAANGFRLVSSLSIQVGCPGMYTSECCVACFYLSSVPQ